MNIDQIRLLLKNRMATNSMVRSLREKRAADRGPKFQWQNQALPHFKDIFLTSSDGSWRHSRAGKLAWRSSGLQCVNQNQRTLPWWWYRDFYYPELRLAAINDALAYREDHIWPDLAPPYGGEIWSSDGCSFRDITPQFRDRSGLSKTEAAELRSSATYMPGVYFYLGWLTSHYGHFLLESLSLIWPNLDHDLDFSGVQYVAFSAKSDGLWPPEFAEEPYAWFGIGLKDVDPIGQPVIFEKLIIPTPSISLHNPSYGTPAQTSVWDAMSLPNEGTPNRRLYLSRRKYRLWGREVRRPMGNEEEVETLFDQLGFEIIYPETLSLDEQITLYSQCNVIAGAIGSNMYNSVFMPSGSRVLIITPTSFAPLMYFLVNAQKGIATDYFFVDVNAMSHDSELLWHVDVDALKRSLDTHSLLDN
jgi:hypothetical protein